MANTHSIGYVAASNQYLDIASSTNFDLTNSNDRTYEAWVKVNTLVTSGGIFTRWGNEGGGNKNFLVRLDSSGNVDVFTGTGSTTGVSVAGTVSISDGSWHHVAISWSGTTDDKIRLYIDGTLDVTSAAATPGVATSTLVVGGRSGLSGVANTIEMDDVRIWSTKRTASEIDTNKSVELVGTESGLLDYWKLNNDLTNSVSGGGAGSLVNGNSATFSTDVPFTAAGFPYSQAVVIA
jgi:hypothetical protein